MKRVITKIALPLAAKRPLTPTRLNRRIDLNEQPDRKLVGENVVEHIKHMQNVQDATLNHFRSSSRLWKALEKHVREADDCVIFERTGHSHSLSIKEAICPWAKPTECQMLVLVVEVYFNAPEDDAETSSTAQHRIYLPSDLEVNFTNEKFNLWLNTMREKRAKEQDEKNLQRLKELITKYPSQATLALKAIRSMMPRKKRSG